MSKRNVSILVLAMLLALSVAVYAAIPTLESNQANTDESFITLASVQIALFDADNPPDCPGSGEPGCD